MSAQSPILTRTMSGAATLGFIWCIIGAVWVFGSDTCRNWAKHPHSQFRFGRFHFLLPRSLPPRSLSAYELVSHRPASPRSTSQHPAAPRPPTASRSTPQRPTPLQHPVTPHSALPPNSTPHCFISCRQGNRTTDILRLADGVAALARAQRTRPRAHHAPMHALCPMPARLQDHLIYVRCKAQSAMSSRCKLHFVRLSHAECLEAQQKQK